MIGLAADPERTRQIRRANRQQVDTLHGGDLVDALDRFHVLDHAGEDDLAVGLRHMLDERDPPIIRGPAARRHAALSERRVTHRLYRLAGSLGTADMGHLDALHAHVQEAQNKGRVEAGGADDRRDAEALGGHHRELHVMQVVAGVLHVDECGIEASQPDDLDDLRVGDPANMRAKRQPTFAQYPFYPILLHASLPRDVAQARSGIVILEPGAGSQYMSIVDPPASIRFLWSDRAYRKARRAFGGRP